MEALFDSLEVIIIVLWVAFSLFGPKIFQKKNKKKTKHEYPEFPQENSQTEVPRNDQEISEEERKLKEWLEKVFGPEEPAANETYEEPYEEPVYQEEVPVQQKPAAAYYSQPYLPAQKINLKVAANDLVVTENKPSQNKWQGRLGKNQMAYGLVMAELFQKPLALRPKQKVFMKKRTVL